MTIDEKDLVKAGMEVALKPFTDVVSDAVAISGGAWIKEKRIRITARLKEETAKILEQRGVKEPIEPSPSVAVPLLEAAQEEAGRVGVALGQIGCCCDRSQPSKTLSQGLH